MSDRVFEAALSHPAREFRGTLNQSDRAEVDRLIALVELDPSIDGRYIFLFDEGNETYAIYDNNVWRFAFRIVENWVIEIEAISRVDPRQRGLNLRL